MCTNMGRGSSGFDKGENKKAPEFEGSEKQIKWANDIVAKSKDNLRESLNERIDSVRSAGLEKYEKSNIETEKMLNSIANNVLTNLALSWSAKDVIENRSRISNSNSVTIRQTLGMFERSKSNEVKVRDGGGVYNIDTLKNSKKERKKLEKELIEYLKRNKS